MKFEVSIHWSDGSVDRATHELDKTALIDIKISRHVDMPAFKGTMYICHVEVRPV